MQSCFGMSELFSALLKIPQADYTVEGVLLLTSQNLITEHASRNKNIKHPVNVI